MTGALRRAGGGLRNLIGRAANRLRNAFGRGGGPGSDRAR